MEQPVLSEKQGEEKWSSYQFLGRSASIHVPSSPGLGMGRDKLTVDEIRSASVFSDPYYPPSLHAPLITAPSESHHSSRDQTIVYQGEYGGSPHGYPSREFGRQTLDEVEIRQLLLDHIGHRCCWGSLPARTWKISAVEDCNVYVGTLETFIEERDIIKEREPYMGGEIDDNAKGLQLGLWELDLRSEFPLLFVPYKESIAKIPHAEAKEKCSDCGGRGDIACPTCNAGEEPGLYKENQMSECPACYGRGLIAHRDGSDTICNKCGGKGMLPCVICGSRGLIKCQTCEGQGSLVTRSIAVVKWRTLTNRKVSATSGAASVPDDVFHKASGVQLYNTQAYQCTPAFFADSYLLNRFSSEVIAERSPISPTARVICERHTISVVPVTRVTMAHKSKSFSFYIVGISREVYIRDYPSKFCWGFCCCLDWLKV